MKLYLTEDFDEANLWCFDGEEDTFHEFEKQIWLENFDGTAAGFVEVCEILHTRRIDVEHAYISNKITIIGDEAFCFCYSLKSVSIPDSIIRIGGAAFYGCSSLTSITIPSRVTYIGGRAFCDCSALEIITIPDSVEYIGVNAFEGCSSLTVYTKNPYAIDYCEKNSIKYSTKF